jgi:hypothetical protein
MNLQARNYVPDRLEEDIDFETSEGTLRSAASSRSAKRTQCRDAMGKYVDHLCVYVGSRMVQGEGAGLGRDGRTENDRPQAERPGVR